MNAHQCFIMLYTELHTAHVYFTSWPFLSEYGCSKTMYQWSSLYLIECIRLMMLMWKYSSVFIAHHWDRQNICCWLNVIKHDLQMYDCEVDDNSSRSILYTIFNNSSSLVLSMWLKHLCHDFLDNLDVVDTRTWSELLLMSMSETDQERISR